MQIQIQSVKFSKSDALLVRSFAHRSPASGRIEAWCTTLHTSDGTPSLWRFFDQGGYTIKGSYSGRGILGHAFCRTLTLAGKKHIEELTK